MQIRFSNPEQVCLDHDYCLVKSRDTLFFRRLVEAVKMLIGWEGVPSGAEDTCEWEGW
jgi:hypothetical protein